MKNIVVKEVTLLLQFACEMFAFAQKRFNLIICGGFPIV